MTQEQELELWTAIYVASIRAGMATWKASENADMALATAKLRFN